MALRLTFRAATAADAPAVASLVQSGYRGESSHKGWTTEADLLKGQRIDSDGVLEKITSPQSYVILAYESPEVNGAETASGQVDTGPSPLLACCELAKRTDSVGYFGLFTVDPLKQAGGIGKQLLAEAERRAKLEMGLRQMEMQVIWLRTELIAWYERRGYQIVPGVRIPFPYEIFRKDTTRDDLYFVSLKKDL